MLVSGNFVAGKCNAWIARLKVFDAFEIFENKYKH